MILAMIPARMGSQRLKQKNLRELGGVPLITRAIRNCRAAGVFDAIWVNSEHPAFGEIAAAEGVHFHRRPEALGNNQATSEQFIAEFLQAHDCDVVVQVHSIAPLLTVAEIRDFVAVLARDEVDCLLSTDPVQIECAYRGQPVNFSFAEKTNSQDLEPIQRLSWSITAWRRRTYLDAVAAGQCATYAGRVGFHPISALAGHIIKTERDLQIAEALLPLVEND
ncbi:MAG: NTP transferase domain-containing protein [Thiocapsa sp.]|uniref:acylneuraminate cytidylyltransferase family protein n=1 Tax=Thiocapsa sp. TaxID=2024551 RepID=UPI001BCEA640|nr:NTP transferase domain-containing protein [Thiocapsa sp.]QVL50116.1 MAG: NTP transferase domain-containing protein [Thiocapsa sp.]